MPQQSLRSTVLETSLAYRVVLDASSKHPSLYTWSLNEIDEGGAQKATNQIPWDWGADFEIVDLQLFSTDGIAEYGSQGLYKKDFLKAKLIPGPQGALQQRTKYSMFGVDGAIEDFTLGIYPDVDGDNDRERCRVWGDVAKTLTVDIIPEETDDSLLVTLYLPMEHFERLARRVENGSAAGGLLRLSGVAGFYSHWSPSIFTSDIKVLTADKKDQGVEIPDGCDIDPPRLGSVGEFDLSIWSQRASLMETKAATNGREGGSTYGGVQIDQRAANGASDASQIKILGSLRLAAWVAVSLLALLLFK